jgi:hypothetical protein
LRGCTNPFRVDVDIRGAYWIHFGPTPDFPTEKQRQRLIHPLSNVRRWRASLNHGNSKSTADPSAEIHLRQLVHYGTEPCMN